MNKTFKVFATLLACFALTATCFAAPRGGRGHGKAPAPRHHQAPKRHHKAPPPPPPRHTHHHHHHHGHHNDRHCGWVTLGAAVVGGLVGGLCAR